MWYERLRNLREDSDLTVRDMAKVIGISKSEYSRFETGEQIIPLKHLNTFCIYFNTSIDYIFGFTRKRKFESITKQLNIDLIAKRVRQLRNEKDLTQVKLAAFLNTTHSTISSYENAHSLILTSFLYQISKKYKVSADWLSGRK